MRTDSVELVNMPFGPLNTPSLALSTIKPILKMKGIDCNVRYLNISFAEAMGENIYHYIACGLPRSQDLVGEYIFSKALFGDESVGEDMFLAYLCKVHHAGRGHRSGGRAHELIADLHANLHIYRNAAVDFVRQQANILADMDTCIFGFTSVFQQNTPSLALAKRVKALRPDVSILLGGANLEGEMGQAIFDQFSFVDCVVSGEAEPVIVEVIRALNDRRVPNSLPGVHFRAPEARSGTISAPMMLGAMDELPIPDYEDFFTAIQFRTLPVAPRLLFETSRGCWWGEKHHCTFCGLNGQSMKFRSKSPNIVIDQLSSIARSHPGISVSMTDNIIDYRYIQSVLPLLQQIYEEIDIFYEVKSNLRKEQLSAISASNIKVIQPGIESSDDEILFLMKKGVSGLQNIQLLKWSLEFGILPAWNFLWGFPGESPLAYHKMANLIPSLTHLTPPQGIGRIRIDRFSPYFRDRSLGFVNIRPCEAYYLVYPLTAEFIRNVAYFFEGDVEKGVDATEYTSEVSEKVREWKDNSDSVLAFIDLGELGALILDTRFTTDCHISLLNPVAKELLLSGDSVCGIDKAISSLESRHSRERIEAELASLERRRLIVVDGERFLTLSPMASDKYPGREFLRSIDLGKLRYA